MECVQLPTKGKDAMQRWILPMIGLVTLVGIGLTAAAVRAEPDPLLQVSVAFGRGLNTAQPGNAVNHVILPDDIKVTEGGVVHFLVSGFHQIFVYQAGTELADINVPAAGTFINDLDDLLYQGINPAGGPLETPATPIIIPGPTPDDTRSNASNRVESVSFAERGTYLVICNVRGHFNDGMFAVVQVVP